MKNIIVKTSYSEYDFLQVSKNEWVLRECRDVKCFRPGAYRSVMIKPVTLSTKEVKTQLETIKATKTIHWTKTK